VLPDTRRTGKRWGAGYFQTGHEVPFVLGRQASQPGVAGTVAAGLRSNITGHSKKSRLMAAADYSLGAWTLSGSAVGGGHHQETGWVSIGPIRKPPQSANVVEF
jgi:hypothetical protein